MKKRLKSWQEMSNNGFSKKSLHLSKEKRIFAKKRNDANNIYIFRIQIHVLF